MRVPLHTDFVARLSSPSKDARTINGLHEGKADSVHVKKRPGLASTGYNYSGIQGVLGLGGLLYLVYNDTFEESAYDGTPIGGGGGGDVHIGDLVDGYYAMVDNPSTSPGPGDVYWSLTPPDSRRYQAYYNLQLTAYAANSPDYWAYRGDIDSGSGYISHVPTTDLGATREACVQLAIDSMPSSCPGVFTETLLEFTDTTNSWSKWVEYFPFAYRFDEVYVDVDSVTLYYINDTVNPGFELWGAPITECGWAYLSVKSKYILSLTFDPTPPIEPADPVCADATTSYSALVFKIIRTV